MMNRTPTSHENAAAALGRALRDLPDRTPHDGTWQRIRERAERRQRRRRLARTVLPLAMAASVLAALGIAHVHHEHAAPAQAVAERGAPVSVRPASAQRKVASLTQLQQHSMRLERWLAELRANGAPLQGRALARAVGLQDRIGLIDLQLSAPGDGGDRRDLWQQRIRLLQDLAMLRVTQSPLSGRQAMAETGGPTPTEL